MRIRVAINGFGRIGRMACRLLQDRSDVELVAINDLSPVEALRHALLYDSVHGMFPKEIRAGDGALIIGEQHVEVLQEKDPSRLPWERLNVDVVIESTGVFTTKDGMQKHIDAGAKGVVLSAPAKGSGVMTVLRGVNHEQVSASQPLVSHASCTTTCIGPVMSVLEDTFGVQYALMTTVHAYTATQPVVDGADTDARRARAAAINIVPTSTGAATATAEAIPSLAGTFDGVALRVPVVNGSIADITAVLNTSVTVNDVNEAFQQASQTERWKGILAVSSEPIVSSDIVGRTESAIVDLPYTMVAGGTLVKVMAWYDNEVGYSSRLVEQVVHLGTVMRERL